MSAFETATLEALSLAQLVGLYNDHAAAPVKKFSSKADAIKRIQALDVAAEESTPADELNEAAEEAYPDVTDEPVEGSEIVTLDDAVPTFEESHPDEELPVEDAEVTEPTVETTDEQKEEPAEAAAPPLPAFQYLTRDALKVLADNNPEARAAYRMERRKQARAKRKAKAAKAA